MDEANRRIRDLRIGMLHMEQEEFSEKTGIPLTRLKKIEKETVRVKISDIMAVSETFDISTDFLLGSRKLPSPPIRNEKDARIWGLLERLPDDQLLELMEHLAEELHIQGEDGGE